MLQWDQFQNSFKKGLIWGKCKGSAIYFQFNSITLNFEYSKNKLHEV